MPVNAPDQQISNDSRCSANEQWLFFAVQVGTYLAFHFRIDVFNVARQTLK